MGTTAANPLHWSIKKRLSDGLAADKRNKVYGDSVAVSDWTTQVKFSDLTLLNDIPELLKDLQAKIGPEIQWEQVSSLHKSLTFQ